MNKETKEEMIGMIISFLLLADCIALYFLLGLWPRFGFPTYEVLAALPISLATWGICAVTDSKKYVKPMTFVATVTFGATVYTGMFLMLWRSS